MGNASVMREAPAEQSVPEPDYASYDWEKLLPEIPEDGISKLHLRALLMQSSQHLNNGQGDQQFITHLTKGNVIAYLVSSRTLVEDEETGTLHLMPF